MKNTILTIMLCMLSLFASAEEKIAAQANSTVSLILYDARTNQPVAGFNPIQEGDVINLNKVGVKLSIVAKVEGQAGSVKFSYNGTESYKVESGAPYTIRGDKDGNIYWWTPDLGNNTVTATVYSKAKAQGSVLGTTTVNFRVVNQETEDDEAPEQEEPTEEQPEEPAPTPEEPEEDEPVTEIPADIVIKNTVTVSKSMQIDKKWTVESHTHIKGTPGAVIKVDPGSIQGGFVLKGVRDVIIEGVTIDVSASRNFVSGIWLENTSNVIIRNCKFINSKKSTADPAWTIHGINARNIKHVQVLNNVSDGCQFKLDGGTYSAEDVTINDNDIRDCTQMGISVVAIPHSEKVVIKNITIKRNKIDKTDNHGIYVGVDNGKGEYTYPTTLENIVIADNTIGELSHLRAGQSPKGILINGTKDAKNIQVINNTITNPKLNEYIMGIQMKCLDGGKTSGLFIKGNQITGFGNFNVYIEGAQDIAVSGNYFKQGKGVIVKNSANGSLYNNYFTDTSGKIRIVSSSNVTAD